MADPSPGPGEVAVAREALLRQLVTFARELRRRGAEVPADATLLGAEALADVGLADRDRVRAALRAALVGRREDLEAFETLFPAFWRALAAAAEEPPDDGAEEGLALPDPEAGVEEAEEGDAGGDGEPGSTVETRLAVGDAADDAEVGDDDGEGTPIYSPSGRPSAVEAGALRGVDAALAGPVRELTDALASLRGRRWSPGGDARPDVRRALRRSVETGGTVIDLPGRERRRSALKAVLLVDVSRSVLDTVDRGFLVSFVRAVREAGRDVAVFFFDTSVREVTDAFDAPTPAAALEALEAAEAAWGGGTRIGHAVATLRREHPTRVDRDTAVLVVSDGLEVGEIDVLEREMAWLAGRAMTVLWANPLAAADAYEPTCRGMAAAAPYVDGLFAFAGPDDVAEMARQLARQGPGGRVGYRYDARRAGARKR
ncbi:MAG: VWA domain-containing protein [Halobacteriales archaeon]|nr:VWA domain-containing protein [Halobacteriales archaeon]